MKSIYFFGNGKADGSATDKNLLGEVTVDKVTSFVEVLHKNLEAVIDYVTPFGFNEDFGDEEE